MTTEAKTKGQTYHEEVEALKAKGMSNAEAVKAVAKQHGKSVGAIRGSLYQHQTRQNGATPRRSRRAPLSVEDHVASARQSLHAALSLIDAEIAEAKTGAERAQAYYEQLNASAAERKAEIEQRLAALS